MQLKPLSQSGIRMKTKAAQKQIREAKAVWRGVLMQGSQKADSAPPFFDLQSAQCSWEPEAGSLFPFLPFWVPTFC